MGALTRNSPDSSAAGAFASAGARPGPLQYWPAGAIQALARLGQAAAPRRVVQVNRETPSRDSSRLITTLARALAQPSRAAAAAKLRASTDAINTVRSFKIEIVDWVRHTTVTLSVTVNYSFAYLSDQFPDANWRHQSHNNPIRRTT